MRANPMLYRQAASRHLAAIAPLTAWLTLQCCLWLAAPGATAAPAEEFERLLHDEWEWRLREFPLFASRQGDRRYNERWTDLGLPAVERRQADRRDFQERWQSIDPRELPGPDQLNYRLFGRYLDQAIEAHRFRGYLLAVMPRGGVQSLENNAELVPMATVADVEDWLERLGSIEQLLEQTRGLLETGREQGVVAPRILMERLPRQLQRQVVDNPEDSPFFALFEALPDNVAEADRARLQARALATLETSVIPAYRRFAAYFSETYLPASRDSVGLSALPDGQAWYEYLARSYTTTDMTPGQIHALGLREVERIRGEMDSVIAEVGFDGDFPAFLAFLRSDPQFYHDSPEALFEGYLAISKRIDPKLVTLFGKLPRMPYGLRPIPANLAPDTTTAYYYRPAADGSRAGYYYVNLYRPEVRPKYEMPVLSVHEAVPGHHLQLALQMELENLPRFRRYSGFTAFTEGWGLYSERLGFDLGLYDDPYDHFGALTYDMWRAVRLVVDTGMHYLGWSRQRAIDYFKANAAKTEADIVNEIDRYIAMPGQALAYKIGQLKMLELRNAAETSLGENFDIRAFHDELLGAGALPLDVLEQRMRDWISLQQEEG